MQVLLPSSSPVLRRRRVTALGLLVGLMLGGCGDGESSGPEADGPDSGGAQVEQTAPDAPSGPEIFEADRFFVHVGPEGSSSLTFGRHEQQGELLAAGDLAGEERARTLAAMRAGLARALEAPAGGKPVLMVIAGPQTPWSYVGPFLSVAGEPAVNLRQLDLRLPWDRGPKPLDLAPSTDEEAPLDIEVLPAQAPARAEVRIGKTGVFLLYDGKTDADKARHRESISALRAALQGYAGTWKGKSRHARIRVVTTPAPEPGYIHVLAVARVCREKRFDELSFVLEEAAPAK